MSNDDTLSDTANSDSWKQPVNHDNSHIHWDENDASIDGALYQFGLWVERTGTYALLLEHGAVSFKGKIYLDNEKAHIFIMEILGNKNPIVHSITNPCPPTPERVTVYEAAAAQFAKDKPSEPAWKAINDAYAIPESDNRTYIVNPYEVKKARSHLLDSLNCIFGKADWAEELTIYDPPHVYSRTGPMVLEHSSE